MHCGSLPRVVEQPLSRSDDRSTSEEHVTLFANLELMETPDGAC